MDKDKSARIIASKAVIEREGFYRVKVSSTCNYSKVRAGGAKQIGIVNFAARSIFQDKEMNSLYRQGMYAEASYVGLSASILEHQFFPTAGTMVDITVELITTKNKVTGLFVTGITKAIPTIPKKRSLVDYLFDTELYDKGVDVLEVLEIKEVTDETSV
jgi:hypothetical protein